MKLIKEAGKIQVKISKKEWQDMGKEAGWYDDDRESVWGTKKCKSCGNELSNAEVEYSVGKERLCSRCKWEKMDRQDAGLE